MKRSFVAAALVAGCVETLPAGRYGDPAAPQGASEQAGIVAQVLSPPAGVPLTTPRANLVVSAYLRARPQPLTVTVGTPDGASLAMTATGAPGPAQRFAAGVPLLHGTNALTVRVATADEANIRYLGYSLRYEGRAPGLRARIHAGAGMDPCANATAPAVTLTRAATVCVRGMVTTASGRSVRSVTVAREGGTAVTAMADASGRFAAAVSLLADRAQTVTVRAEDDAGMRTEVAVPITHDGTGPTLAVTGVMEGQAVRVEGDSYMLAGTVSDPSGVDLLRVEYEGGGTVSVTPAASFMTTLRLDPGDNRLTVVAVDGAGNERRLRFTLARDREFVLGAPPEVGAATQLDLDRFAIERLFTVADQQAINLVEVPLRPALLGALRAIRDPFTSGVDTSTWRAAEWNLQRLLTMTPDTADLRGSSLEPLLQIAGAIGLAPPRVLAQLLDTTTVSPFIDLDTVADVLLDQLVGTHPNAQRNASGQVVLRLTMYDVLQDLRTLSTRYGPSGAHPGFLAAGTTARALEPGFSMSIPVRSTLRPYEGVDLTSNTKRFLYLAAGASVLDFDFTSDRFAVVGIVDQPVVDLGFSILESPSFARAGTSRTAGADPMRAGFYRGDGAVWSLSPWLIERIVAESAYRQYHNRFATTAYARTLRYDAGSIRDAAVIDWARGWVTIRTAGGLGSPPAPTYLWDVLTEVAQTRLHDGGVMEGAANLAFTLRRVPIGLTADDLVRSLRPTLMAQRAELSRRLVGGGALAASPVDVYFVPSSDATAPGFLFFRAAADGGGPTYATPGFFSDAALTRRVSVTMALAGTTDTAHEKVAATMGLRVYARDDAGGVYGITVLGRDAAGLRVRVSREGAR
ncbi:MAG: hypothetical protein U0324_03750 [Polyangiales bacterium]